MQPWFLAREIACLDGLKALGPAWLGLKKMFVSWIAEKNRLGRSIKKNLHYFFCVFYACFMLIGSWMGDKNFGVGIFWIKTCKGRVTGNKHFLLCPSMQQVPPSHRGRDLARNFITGCPNWDFKNLGCPKSLIEKVKIITLIIYFNK